jgi:hypothetical protein
MVLIPSNLSTLSRISYDCVVLAVVCFQIQIYLLSVFEYIYFLNSPTHIKMSPDSNLFYYYHRLAAQLLHRKVLRNYIKMSHSNLFYYYHRRAAQTLHRKGTA